MATAMLTGDSGKSYSLSFGTNAWCRAEILTGHKYNEILTMLGSQPSATFMRAIIKATLIDPADQTDEQVGDIIDDIGGFEVLQLALASPGQTPVSAQELGVH